MSDTPDSVAPVTAVAKPSRPRAPGSPASRLPTPGRPPPAGEAWIEALPDAQQFLTQRRRRRQSLFLRLALLVALPTLATFGYFAFVATPRHTVQFQTSYQTYQGATTLAAGLVQSAAGTSVNNTIDLGTVLYQYFRSPALLAKLDRQLGLRAYFSNPKIDYFSRLSADASEDAFLSYFHARVAASEGFGGYVQVDVQAFDAPFAQQLAEAVIKASEEMLDEMTAKVRKKEVQLAEDEVARQEARVRAARKALTDFQNAHGDLDPNRGATQLGDIVGTLETTLSTARAQLANALTTLSESSPIVAGVKTQIASLEAQLRDQRNRMAGTAPNTPYSEILDEYSALQLNQDFAKTAYSAAQQGLNVARFDAVRTQNSLAIFAPPSRTDASRLASAGLNALTTFLVTSLLFGVSNLMVAAFRDQAGY